MPTGFPRYAPAACHSGDFYLARSHRLSRCFSCASPFRMPAGCSPPAACASVTDNVARNNVHPCCPFMHAFVIRFPLVLSWCALVLPCLNGASTLQWEVGTHVVGVGVDPASQRPFFVLDGVVVGYATEVVDVSRGALAVVVGTTNDGMAFRTHVGPRFSVSLPTIRGVAAGHVAHGVTESKGEGCPPPSSLLFDTATVDLSGGVSTIDLGTSDTLTALSITTVGPYGRLAAFLVCARCLPHESWCQ